MMVQEKEDLGLSLSLSFPSSDDNNNQTAKVSSSPLQLNLIPSSTFNHLHNTTWNQQSAADRNIGTCRPGRRPSLTGIDVNRLPATTEMEEQTGVSSPNSTLSSLSGNKRNLIHERSEQTNGEDLPECSRSDEEEGEHSRKKLRLSKEQSTILEENFKEHNTLNTRQKIALAKRLGLRPRQVEVWFQNRRARTKLKQTEVDCELLRRCCETLTEQNRKLQKEVQELKTLKLSPQFYMQMAPPTTLTMCPSCEGVAVPPSTTAVSIGLSMTPTEPPQPHQMHTNVHRSPFNAWASKPVATRPLDVLRPQS